LKTPPYVTAEPVVTTTQIDPTKGDFVVLATDGLWEMLTNEEVVGLVAQWLDHQKYLSQKGDGGKGFFQGWFSSEKPLPVEKPSQQDDASGQRLPIRQRQYNITNSNRFVVEDKNAATHLVRNALGGKDRDMVCALLTLPSPYSRRYRYVLRSHHATRPRLTRIVLGTISPCKSSSLVKEIQPAS
jgi:pyruvate dehydrogenase phosphatase